MDCRVDWGCVCFFFFLFFFQAEDGIRDDLVTGRRVLFRSRLPAGGAAVLAERQGAAHKRFPHPRCENRAENFRFSESRGAAQYADGGRRSGAGALLLDRRIVGW